MSSTRGLFSRFRENVSTIQQGVASFTRNPRVVFSASFIVMGVSQLLDTACNQKLENKPFADYYTEAPSRIAWLILSSLFLAVNLTSLIQTLRGDVDLGNTINLRMELNPVSAKKIFIGCTVGASINYFIQKSLSTPITFNNAFIVICSTAINGTFYGSLITTSVYYLKNLNYTVLPFTRKDMQLMSAGILISILQELLDFICTQKTEHNTLEWELLVTPRRLLALHLYNSILQGVFYGISLCNLKKYSILGPSEDKMVHRIRNIMIGVPAIASPVGTFIHQSLTVPLRLSNAPYIIADSIIKGVPSGVVSGIGFFTLTRLISLRNVSAQQPDLERPLLNDGTNIDAPPSPSAQHALTMDDDENDWREKEMIRAFP